MKLNQAPLNTKTNPKMITLPTKAHKESDWNRSTDSSQRKCKTISEVPPAISYQQNQWTNSVTFLQFPLPPQNKQEQDWVKKQPSTLDSFNRSPTLLLACVLNCNLEMLLWIWRISNVCSRK